MLCQRYPLRKAADDVTVNLGSYSESGKNQEPVYGLGSDFRISPSKFRLYTSGEVPYQFEIAEKLLQDDSDEGVGRNGHNHAYHTAHIACYKQHDE